MNNTNNNQINFEAPHNVNYANKYKKMTISFIIILFINAIIEIYSYFIRTNYRKYVFQYAPIFEKNQYYRFISSYFIHYGIWHIIVELYLTYEICYLFENIMGTLITILFIMNTMIMNSVLHFLMIPLVSLFFKITRTSYDLNYDYESSLTSVLFSMTTFYYLFKDNKNKKIDVLYTFILNLNYLSITMFFVLYFLTPNKSFYSNLSGLINGYLFKFFPFIFLPRVTWVTDFEKFIGLKKYENVYRSITYKNGPMKNALNELQNNSIVDESLLKNINYGNDFNNIGQQMTELTNIQNNNLNNN
jgi:membrane associated rhomboid family serine protease